MYTYEHTYTHTHAHVHIHIHTHHTSFCILTYVTKFHQLFWYYGSLCIDGLFVLQGGRIEVLPVKLTISDCE